MWSGGTASARPIRRANGWGLPIAFLARQRDQGGSIPILLSGSSSFRDCLGGGLAWCMLPSTDVL